MLERLEYKMRKGSKFCLVGLGLESSMYKYIREEDWRHGTIHKNRRVDVSWR